MDIFAKVINAGELQVINPAENNSLREPLYVRNIEVSTYQCHMGEARAVTMLLHLMGKVATSFNPESVWICADVYPSSRKSVNQEGKEFTNTDINVRSIAPILSFT